MHIIKKKINTNKGESMKRIIDKLSINKVNNFLDVLQKIFKVLYILILLLIIYFVILICKEWRICKLLIEILGILVPLFLGIIISYILNPIIKKLSKKMKRTFAVSVIYLAIVIIVIFFCCYIYPIFIEEINELIKYLPDIIEEANHFINNINHNKFNIEIDKILGKYITSNMNFQVSKIFFTLKNVIKIFGVIILGLIISFYLSLNFDESIKNLFHTIPIKNKKKLKKLLLEIDTNVFSYVKGVFFIAFIVFIVSSISFQIINLKGSIFFGLFNSITNIIPYIGPYIGAIPIILVAFTSSNKIGVEALIVVIVIQVIESYILQPLIMSKSMKLHPVTILIGLLIFGYFFGIIGMILATPIVSIIKTVFQFFYKES